MMYNFGAVVWAKQPISLLFSLFCFIFIEPVNCTQIIFQEKRADWATCGLGFQLLRFCCKTPEKLRRFVTSRLVWALCSYTETHASLTYPNVWEHLEI